MCEMDSLSVDSLAFMFCILRSSPNLQKLSISADTVDETFRKDSFTAATSYLDAVGKEGIKTSVTTLLSRNCWSKSLLTLFKALQNCGYKEPSGGLVNLQQASQISSIQRLSIDVLRHGSFTAGLR